MDEQQQQINEQPETALGRQFILERTGSALRQELIRSGGTSQGARMVTVHASCIFDNPGDIPPVEIENRQLALDGLLEWGQGSARFQAEVDVKNGAAFSVVASFVALSVGFRAPIAAGGPTEPDPRFPRCTASGAIVWGTRPGRSFPTKTRGPATIAAGETVTFRIPNFSSSVLFATTDSEWYESDALISFHSGPTISDLLSLVLRPSQLPGHMQSDGVKWPESARFVTIANAEDAEIQMQAVFQLVL